VKAKCVALALAALLVFALSAGARSMELGDGAVFGDADPSRDIQETIWFQGFVADPGTGDPINATYTVTARMYDAEFGGASVWGPESHVATVIVDGWFNIELGAVVGGLPAFDTPPYYLQLTIGGETLEPRLKLASVPSAFQSLGADNGLSLPYSATYGTSGNAFHITNTGPNICGGPGAAVMGWQTGTGPAIKGVANGSGYAGEFDGPVVVGDSMRVAGEFVASNNARVPDTLYVTEGFQFAPGATEGYVLRCADSWGNAEWAPAVVVDVHNESGDIPLTDSYAQIGDAQVTLTVPGSGYIMITTSAWFQLDHTSTTTDLLYVCHSTSQTSFSGAPYGTLAMAEMDWSAGTHHDFNIHMTVNSTHAVTSSGTYTYYLVAKMSLGYNANDKFKYSQTTAVYHPYPVGVRAASDNDVVFPTTGDAAPR